jgi:hypothetical protein
VKLQGSQGALQSQSDSSVGGLRHAGAAAFAQKARRIPAKALIMNVASMT